MDTLVFRRVLAAIIINIPFSILRMSSSGEGQVGGGLLFSYRCVCFGILLALVILLAPAFVLDYRDKLRLKGHSGIDVEASPQLFPNNPFKLLNLSRKARIAAIDRAIKVNNLILEELSKKYGDDSPQMVYNDAMGISAEAKAFLKAKMISKIVHQSKFVFAFSGTSVTAGHDNYFNASYPIVFGEIVKPAFKTAGVELESRNFAMGSNPVIPYDLCVQALAGSDVDVVSWEQSMNCPRSTPNCMEIFTRNSIKIPSMPAVLIADAVPNFPDDWRPMLDKPAQYLIDPDQREDLLKKYNDWGIHYYVALVAVKNRNLKPELSMPRMVQDGKPFEVKKNWHPGPYGHLLNAHVLSYHYLQILKEALEELKNKLELSFADQAVLFIVQSCSVASGVCTCIGLLASLYDPTCDVVKLSYQVR
jgi:hypothetical protein